MSDPSEQILCERHGKATPTPVTFVCRHIHDGCGCGFHDCGDEGDEWPDAWCDKCEAILERMGEWTDEMASRDLTVLCTGCYEEARSKNRRIPAGVEPGQLATDEEAYRRLVAAAHRDCNDRQARAFARWQFDAKGRWHYDGSALWFFDVGDTSAVTAEVEIVGSFSTRSNTWMWAWGNEEYSAHARAKVLPVQVFGEVRGIEKLTSADWAADLVDAWEVTQIAAVLLDAEAIYRAPMNHLLVFMLLRGLRHADAIPEGVSQR
jgi:hypothetical protein